MKQVILNGRLSFNWSNLCIMAILIGLLHGNLYAEPYFAARTGFKCSQCHVNRTGGGKRTDYGVIYSQYKLMMANAMSEKQAFSFDPKLSNSVSIGANFRVEPTYTLKYTTKPQDAAKVPAVQGEKFETAPIRESNLYFQVDLVKDVLTYYADVSGATIREMWGMLQFGPSYYIKAGQMLLPYGIRLMDDDAFVRNVPGYTYGVSAPSIEVGIEPGPLSLIVNANDGRISSVGYFVFREMPMALRTIRLGGSYSVPVPKVDRRSNNSMGVFGMASMGMFSILAEHDLTKKDSINKVEDYVEVDFLPMQGLNFKVVMEWMTPNKLAQGHNGRRRLTLGVEPYVMQFMQLGLYYRKNDFVPQAGSENQDQVVGRVHVYF
jgi:hypothetical protein